jgi:hypothetical protein
VFDLLDSDCQDVRSPILRPKAPSCSAQAASGGGIQLGDFTKLYETLGYPTSLAVPLPPLDESELSNTDDALLPSPGIQSTVRKTSTKAQLPQTSVISAIGQQPETPSGLTKKERRKIRKQAEAARHDIPVQEKQQDIAWNESQEPLPGFAKEKAVRKVASPSKLSRAQSNVGAKIRPTSPLKPESTRLPQTPAPTPRPALGQLPMVSFPPATPQRQVIDQTKPAPSTPQPTTTLFQPSFLLPHLQSLQATLPISNGLVPTAVRPTTVPRHSQPVMPTTPSPMPGSTAQAPLANPSAVTVRTQVDRHFHLFQKLLNRFMNDTRWLISPKQLVNESTAAEGIHVFVDASNIMYGFKDLLRYKRVQQFDISFDSLALLMERRRPVAKRILVGSHRESNPHPQVTKLIDTCKAVGYEANVQEQVYIVREPSEKKRFFDDVSKHGWQKAIQRRSGSGSDSETAVVATPSTPSAPKWVEQGVDELLHLKMCQSLLDTAVPGIMVLATGDGAAAEMSDGFLAHVERALRLGWKVELISWRQQTNGGYKSRAFKQQWGDQFTIIELDDFLEDLIDTE